MQKNPTILKIKTLSFVKLRMLGLELVKEGLKMYQKQPPVGGVTPC